MMKSNFHLKAKVFKVGDEYSAQLINEWLPSRYHFDQDEILINSKEWVNSEYEALVALVLYNPEDNMLLYEAKHEAFSQLLNDALKIERVWY